MDKIQSLEIKLGDAEFERLRKLIYNESGIKLDYQKKDLVKNRLNRRLRILSIPSFREYFDFVNKDKSKKELTLLLDAISTNFTSFFREQVHFEFLDKRILPELAHNYGGDSNRQLRAWCAASSSGEEPYSILFTLLENKNIPSTWPIKFLATDISVQMLETATKGLYESKKLSTVPKTVLEKYFLEAGGELPDTYFVKDEIRKKITFRRFNLITPSFPFKHKFDFIFCRNVMIYFDNPTREKLVNKFYDSLQVGGYLIVGHSESLAGIRHPFKNIKPTVYYKI